MSKATKQELHCIWCGKTLKGVTMKKIKVIGTQKKQLVPSNQFCTAENHFSEPLKKERSCHRRYKYFIKRLNGKDAPREINSKTVRRFIQFALVELIMRKPAEHLNEQLIHLCKEPSIQRKMECNFRKFIRRIEEIAICDFNQIILKPRRKN